MLVRIIGGAPFAVSIIVTIFMAGLGIGSLIAGRWVDRFKEPFSLVKLYGLLELITAIYAALIPIAIKGFEPLYSFLYNRLFEHFLLFYFLTLIGCAVLLLPPVVCMGATLPALCRFCARSISSVGTNTGGVYGLNAIGAAVGALVSGFWLVGHLGMRGTLAVAVIINGVVGISCLAIGFRRTLYGRLKQTTEAGARDVTEDAQSPLYASGTVLLAVLLAFGVSGFCSMSYEVIWTRLLGLIIGPTTYSFTIVLVTFITGLALGSMFFGWLADRKFNLLTVLLVTQLLAGLSALGVSQLIGNSQFFFAKLIDTYKDSFTALSLLKGLILFVFMVVPTLFIGAAFPLVIRICTRTVTKLGNTVGLAYTANTIGAVLGSFSAGFLTIPLLGKERGLSFVVAIQLITVLCVALVLIRQKRGLLRLSLLVVLLVPSFYFVSKYPAWNRLLLARGRYHRIDADVSGIGWLRSLFEGKRILAKYEEGKLVFYGDGIGGFTAVLEYFNPVGQSHYSMLNSGKADASSHADMETQTLLAHFPLLFHPGAKDVMVLGLASGITSGEVLCYPVREVDTLEISPEVVKACRFFTPWNNNVLSDPRSHIILQDARAHLQLTNKTYDVIISEPSNPWMAGLATLFTLDFFELAKSRLNNNGIFVQFFHSYQMDPNTFAMVGRTFTKAFPNSILLVTYPSKIGSDFLFVGFKGEYGLNLENAEKNIVYARLSKNIRLSDPKLLYRMIVAEDLYALFGNGQINTDEMPVLEFSAPKQMYLSDAVAIQNRISDKNTLRSETRAIIDSVKTNIDSQIEYAAYALSVHKPFADMVDWVAASDTQKEKVRQLFKEYCRHDIIDFTILPDGGQTRQGCLAAYITTAEENLGKCENKVMCHLFLGDQYAALGDRDKAFEHYQQAVSIDPNVARIYISVAVLQAKNGQYDSAISNLQRAISLDPESPVQVYRELVQLLHSQNRYGEAVSVCKKILAIQPGNTAVLNDLGITYSQMGNYDEAIDAFETALRFEPGLIEAAKNLKLCREARENQKSQ
jgi:spermidine synthase